MTMDAATYLDLLAERARREDAATGPLDRFAARVWWKVAEARRRALAAPDPRPLWYVMGGAAAAAAVTLAWSFAAWSHWRDDSPVPSFVDELFAFL